MINLTFFQLREVNESRCRHWHPGFPEDEAWVLSDWSNAMCGEAGEAANKVKKIRRIEAGHPAANDGYIPALKRDLAEELADVVIYADLLATKIGVDLGAAVAAKFNAVSVREGFPERLPNIDTHPARDERGVCQNCGAQAYEHHRDGCWTVLDED